MILNNENYVFLLSCTTLTNEYNNIAEIINTAPSNRVPIPTSTIFVTTFVSSA